MTSPAALAGRRIVLTRPRDESESLARRIVACGGEALVYPALEIGPPPDEARVAATFRELPSFSLAIFVSPTAVARAFERIEAWPANLPVAAVGPGTARMLERHGVADVIVPERRFDSEGLLEHPRLGQVAGERILIVRGEGGRETLAQGLRGRGATVVYAECYVRAAPAWDPAPLRAALRSGRIDALVVTSTEGLRNLLAAVGSDAIPLFAGTTVVVPHERIARDARALGVALVALSDGAGDDAVVAALGGLRSSRP